MAVSVFPDGNGSKLGGGGGGGGQGADGENAPGKGNELVLDVKDDDLQPPSSFNSASSSMGLINGVRNEGSHFCDNYESRNLRNRLPRVAPEWVASIQVNNSFENRKKGLLSSFYTIAEKLLVFCGSLVILSLSYPLAANAKEAFEDHAMQGIIIGSVISFFICCLLTALASYLRDSESIDGVGFHVFKWLVLLVFLFLSAGLCVILRFCAHTPKAVLWTLGTVGYFIILSIWVWVFYIEVLQIQEEMKKHFEMETRAPSEGPGHVPPLAAPGLARAPV
ncbi:hypothetical protein BDA96_05G068200 [Sorghum bicolor]|uniref:Uncharacterized protein n=1 Tax=Sorghum bicolor TaxID=4558 RepID=A0A921QYF6_SORBI|nr:hypothetical protein BDA96_05G068200 [Sorghum bicolor]